MSRAERDAANNQRVLTELQGVDDALRTARFVCVMAIATPGNEPSVLVRGTFDGRIGTPPRVPAGENGFGYDPLFLVAPAFKLTSAQLPREEKNRMSHRAAAAAAIVAATS